MRQIKRFKNDIAINEYIVFAEENRVGYRIEYEWEDWMEIEPKYYIDKSDDMIFEIWYDRTGTILDRGLSTHLRNGEISTDWGIKRFEEISKELAMTKYKERLLRESVELDAKDTRIGYYDKEMMKVEMSNYNNKNLMQKSTELSRQPLNKWTKKPRGWEKLNYQLDIKKMTEEPKGCNPESIKQQNNGGSSDWYLLPDDAKTLQDLIEHRNMNGAVKDMFKACYRLGIKTEDELRDLNKTAYYALREIGRVSGRKDYITIAKELIGSQAIEKVKND